MRHYRSLACDSGLRAFRCARFRAVAALRRFVDRRGPAGAERPQPRWWWADTAASLGSSKQTVHRKHAVHLATDRRARCSNARAAVLRELGVQHDAVAALASATGYGILAAPLSGHLTRGVCAARRASSSIGRAADF